MTNRKSKIHDVDLITLNQIKDDRGAVYHFLKSNDPSFKGFGEAYYSRINHGVVKGWKLQTKTHQHFCVPFGEIKIVIYDNRIDSPSRGSINKIILNDNVNYQLLSLPPGLWYSFKCISEDFALLANIIDHLHDLSQCENLALTSDKIPFEWK